MPVNIVIQVPQTTKWQPQNATGFINSFLERYQFDFRENYQQIFLEMHATRIGIMWQIFLGGENDPDAITAMVLTYYPDARVTPFYLPFPDFPVHSKTAMFYRPKDVPQLVPMVAEAEMFRGQNDPLIAITNAVSNLQQNEVLVYGIQTFEYKKHKRGLFNRALLAFAKNLQRQNNPMRYVEPSRIEKLVDEKLQRKLASVRFYVNFFTPNPARFHILDTVAGAIATMSDYGVLNSYVPFQYTPQNFDDFYENDFDIRYDKKFDNKTFDQSFLVVNASELATLWHLPHDQITSPIIGWIPQEDNTCVPEELHNIEGIHIGKSCDIDVHLPTDDRTTHTMIIGRNGTGKSSLMHRMIHEDIKSGRGLCVIDPQGNLIPQILQASIPDERLDDVVILDPSMEIDGTRYPPPINPLFKTDGDMSLNILGMIERVYGDFTGTRMEYLLQMALRMLSEEDHPTLMGVSKLFSDPKYARKLVNEADSINLEKQWNDFAEKSVKNQADMTFPLFTRLNRFYDSNQALAVTCHPNSLNLRELVQNNKIILVNLGSKGNKLDEGVRKILGSTIVTQIEAIAKSGAITDPPYLLYVDEAQNFVDTPIDRMLAEVRQHGLGLILANQFLHQFTSDVQDAIEGNVGTMFSFEIGRGDARAMKHYMTTFEADDLTSLGKFKSAVSMRYNNNRQPSFLLETLPPPGSDMDETVASARELEVRRRSVENYTPKSYDEVITWVRETYVTGSDQQPDTDEPEDDDFTEDNPDTTDEQNDDEET